MMLGIIEETRKSLILMAGITGELGITMVAIELFAIYLVLDFVFILFVLRACYYLFVLKTDPLKSITPTIPENWFSKQLKETEKQESYEKSVKELC